MFVRQRRISKRPPLLYTGSLDSRNGCRREGESAYEVGKAVVRQWSRRSAALYTGSLLFYNLCPAHAPHPFSQFPTSSVLVY